VLLGALGEGVNIVGVGVMSTEGPEEGEPVGDTVVGDAVVGGGVVD